MFTFNNETIFTGYVKQLLADFNLPKYRVYTKEDAKYHKQALEHNKLFPEDLWPEEAIDVLESKKATTAIADNYIRYINYIKDNTVCNYIADEDKPGKLKWVSTNSHYHYNKKELNHTKNLVIKSNIYDSYTHEYLGDYLRFQRDYNNLDLMSMYNCFSNVICQNLYINHSKATNGPQFIFDTDDKNYKIYMIPIKLFKKYTIAIDSSSPVEMCCSFYSKYYLSELEESSLGSSNVVEDIERLTYKRFNSMRFNSPEIYEQLWVSANGKKGNLVAKNEKGEDIFTKEERIICTRREDDLKLFIKLPLNNNSSITILEGDYRYFNDSILKLSGTTKAIATIINNKSVSNFDSDDEYNIPLNDQELYPISKLQLLTCNTGISYPFADRLLEYLLDNVISQVDDISDNVKRTQKVINLIKRENLPLTGIWSNEYRHYLYNAIINNDKIPYNNKYDILGYVDKDTEKYYSAINSDNETVTISNINIYPDIYKSNKK